MPARSIIGGRPTANLSDADRTTIRRIQIGFVYQFHHLLPEFTALENVMMPQLIRGSAATEAEKRAIELLAYLRLAEPARPTGRRNSPAANSSASPSRARSPTRRACCLADEPTGNLDPNTADLVFDGADAAGARLRARGPHRHPQHGTRRPHGPAGDAARGAGGGDWTNELWVVEARLNKGRYSRAPASERLTACR